MCIRDNLSVGGYLYASTRNDFLWLDLEQLPHREATILYAQDRETGEWVEYARLEATQQKIWVPLSEIPEDMQRAFVAIEDKPVSYTHLDVYKIQVFGLCEAFLRYPGRLRLCHGRGFAGGSGGEGAGRTGPYGGYGGELHGRHAVPAHHGRARRKRCVRLRRVYLCKRY